MTTEKASPADDEALDNRGAEWKLALFTAGGCAVLSVIGMVLNAAHPGSTQLNWMAAIAAFYGALAAGEFVREAAAAWIAKARGKVSADLLSKAEPRGQGRAVVANFSERNTDHAGIAGR
jgi:hypothetical protein